jgi:hypothetical protein
MRHFFEWLQMFVVQPAVRYDQLRYFSEFSHPFQDLLPFIRGAFVQYDRLEFYADICEVICRESDVAEGKYVISRMCDHTDVSAVGVTGIVKL